MTISGDGSRAAARQAARARGPRMGIAPLRTAEMDESRATALLFLRSVN
jgi:hypothetical protein